MVDSQFSVSSSSGAPSRSWAPAGTEGEMVRVSIASLMDGADPIAPSGPGTPDDPQIDTTQGRHGLVRDLWWDGAITSFSLDLGLASVAPTPATVPAIHFAFALPLGWNALPQVHGVAVDSPIGQSGERLPDDLKVAAGNHAAIGADVHAMDLGAAIFHALAGEPAQGLFGQFLHNEPLVGDDGSLIGMHIFHHGLPGNVAPILDSPILA